MKIFIVEDEVPAQINLKRVLKLNFDNLDFVGTADSVVAAVKWFGNPDNHADIVFMDVELSDGTCFDIFSRVRVNAKVIITTAYDNYAIKAFKVDSVDYLLKPIDNRELVAAVEKCMLALHPRLEDVMANDHVGDMIASATSEPREYKQRFVVKIGDHIIIIGIDDIAYFTSRDKTSYIVTKEGKSYITDQSLDTIETLLNPKMFFRISRACITHINAIGSVSKHFSGRLRISLHPKLDDDIFISRVRTNDFMRWING